MKSGTQQFTKVALPLLQQISHASTASKNTKKQKPVVKLNMFGKGITHIKQLNQQKQYFSNIRQLDLSHNALTNIQNLKVLALVQINLSHNKIVDQENLINIFVKDRNNQLAKNIQRIVLKGNPFTKQTIIPQLKQFLFSIQNDLQLFSKEQNDFLEILFQHQFQKVYLLNMTNKVAVNMELLRTYECQLNDNFQQLLLLRSQTFFKHIKRYVFKIFEEVPFLNSLLKREVVMGLPIQLFGGGKGENGQQQRVSSVGGKQYASRLALYLRDRSEKLAKENKVVLEKLQGNIFNYITLKKMIIEKKDKKEKHTLNLKSVQKSLMTPSKIVTTRQREGQNQLMMSTYRQNRMVQNYRQEEEGNTPVISVRKISPQKLKITVAQKQSNSNFEPVQFTLSTQPRILRKVQNQSLLYSGVQPYRNPFDEIMQQQSQRKNVPKLSLQKRKQNIRSSPKTSSKNIKFDSKNTSKTLFQLSQSLLPQRNMIATSDKSINLQLLQDQYMINLYPSLNNNAQTQSSIQKMFYQILCKTNPIYNLLYSPIQSLKSSQKDTLINNLLQVLKQKFKYIEKIEKYKILFEDVFSKYNQLKTQYVNNKKSSQVELQKMQYMTQVVTNQQKQIQKLSNQIQGKTQQNMRLKNEIQNLQQKLKVFVEIKLSKSYQQQCQEKIKNKYESRIKGEFMKLITKKANKLAKYQYKMQEIGEMEEKNLVQKYFRQLKKQTINSKKLKEMKRKSLSRGFHLLSETLRGTCEINRKIKDKMEVFNGRFKRLWFQEFLSLNNKKKIRQQKVQRSVKFYQMKLKGGLFNFLKENYQASKNDQYEKIVQEFRVHQRQNLKKAVFKEWLVWQKQVYHKQIQVRVNHEGILACNVVQNLCNYYSRSRAYENKSIALQLFLRDMRKMNSFHKFYLRMSLQNRKSKLKLFKINMFTKRIFFDDFTSIIRRLKNRRKIKQKQQNLTKRKLIYGEIDEYKLKRRFKSYKMCSKLREMYFDRVKMEMEKEKKEIELEKEVRNRMKKSFFEELGRMCKIKRSFKQKIQNLYYLTKNIRQRAIARKEYFLEDVFINLRKQHKFRKSFKFFFIKKNKNLLARTFYNFKVAAFKQKAQYFEQKLKELGPDIQLIQKRQIQTNIQKISLMRALQLKDQQVQEYEKQIQELKLLLEAKEIKYEKLKDIYAQSIEIHSRAGEFVDMEKESQKMFPEYIPYEYQNYSEIGLGKQKKDDNYLQRTVRMDSKNDGSRYSNSNMPSAYTVKYSPQRDIAKSKQKRKVSDFILQSKNLQPQFSNVSNLSSISKKKKLEPQKYQRSNISEYYPNFRRF